MRGNLAVKVKDASGERVVTRAVTGLRFRKTANGGHADASCTINLPRSQFPTLGPADRLYVFDTSTADTIWDGYTNNPGTQTGRDGEGFELTALGGMSLATDERRSLIYIDRTLSSWRRGGGAAASATTEVSADPTESVTDDGLLCQFNPGQPIGTGSRASMSYSGLADAGMEFGAIGLRVLDGKTDANFQPQLFWSPPIPVGIEQLGAFNSNDSAFTRYVGDVGAPPSGVAAIGLRLTRTAGGATNVADDNTWAFFYGIAVVARRMFRDGSLVPTGVAGMTTTSYVLASWVVEDLLGRVLTFCDSSSAIIDTTSYQIDQLAYAEAATAASVFEDLGLYEPDFLWEILESDPATGKHRFSYRAWPTTPRYVLPPSIVVEQPGGDVDLCNRIAINWVDVSGIPQVTIRTATVPELGTRVRDADPITLPEGRGSLANAERLGDQVLAVKAAPPRAGTAVVDRPIVDRLHGVTVQPWEIEPGYLVRITSTGEELRLTEMEYDDDSCTATLTIGDPVLTIEQRLARLDRLVK